MSNLKTILLEELLEREGGYVNDPNDSGGATNFGITQAVANRYGFTFPVKDLTKQQAITIYEELYWKPLRLDLVMSISWKLAEELFDTGVNMGVYRAGEFLQRVLNVFNNQGKYYPDLKVDGGIGSKTITALKDYMNHRGHNKGEEVLIRSLNCLQGAFYIELAEKRQKDETFVYGWIYNRVS